MRHVTCDILSQILTFEHRHENKSCSACPEDQLKPFQFLAGNQLMIGTFTGEGGQVKKLIVTFELRHENKSCSACPKDQHKHLTYDM